MLYNFNVQDSAPAPGLCKWETVLYSPVNGYEFPTPLVAGLRVSQWHRGPEVAFPRQERLASQAVSAGCQLSSSDRHERWRRLTESSY